MKSWIVESEEGIIVKIYVQPGASKEAVAGEFGDPPRLKLKINAPPVDGAANKRVVLYLAKILGLAKSNINVIQGKKSRLKDVMIQECTVEDIEALLA